MTKSSSGFCTFFRLSTSSNSFFRSTRGSGRHPPQPVIAVTQTVATHHTNIRQTGRQLESDATSTACESLPGCRPRPARSAVASSPASSVGKLFNVSSLPQRASGLQSQFPACPGTTASRSPSLRGNRAPHSPPLIRYKDSRRRGLRSVRSAHVTGKSLPPIIHSATRPHLPQAHVLLPCTCHLKTERWASDYCLIPSGSPDESDSRTILPVLFALHALQTGDRRIPTRFRSFETTHSHPTCCGLLRDESCLPASRNRVDTVPSTLGGGWTDPT